MSPRSGLHSRDTERLIKILHSLRDLGNTVLVVEHDAEIMRNADRIIDLGPGAGENGGKVIATGTYDEIVQNPASLTGRYLNHDLRIQMPVARRNGNGKSIRLSGRAGTQPEEGRRDDSAGHAGGDHRRFGLGQVDAGARRPVQRGGGRKGTGERRTASAGGSKWRVPIGSTKSCWWTNRRLAGLRARTR